MLVFPHPELYIVTLFLSSTASALGILLASGVSRGAAGPQAVGIIGLDLMAVFPAAVVWVLMQLARIHGVLGVKYVLRQPGGKAQVRRQHAGRTPKVHLSSMQAASASALVSFGAQVSRQPGPVSEAMEAAPSSTATSMGQQEKDASAGTAQHLKARAAYDNAALHTGRLRQGYGAAGRGQRMHGSMDNISVEGRLTATAATMTKATPQTAIGLPCGADLLQQLKQLPAVKTATTFSIATAEGLVPAVAGAGSSQQHLVGISNTAGNVGSSCTPGHASLASIKHSREGFRGKEARGGKKWLVGAYTGTLFTLGPLESA